MHEYMRCEQPRVNGDRVDVFGITLCTIHSLIDSCSRRYTNMASRSFFTGGLTVDRRTSLASFAAQNVADASQS